MGLNALAGINKALMVLARSAAIIRLLLPFLDFHQTWAYVDVTATVRLSATQHPTCSHILSICLFKISPDFRVPLILILYGSNSGSTKERPIKRPVAYCKHGTNSDR